MNFHNSSTNASFKLWLENDYFDKETKDELSAISQKPEEIEERFYRELEFGTGGLRGIIGAGTNRMNKYIVRKASQGIANHIMKQNGQKKLSVVIAFDSRHKSTEFALEAALTFAGSGIKAYLFDELRPTPELSFAVRHLKAAAGVVITASHNPREYNGYKVYGPDGAQLALEASDAILAEINAIEDITGIKPAEREAALKAGLLELIGEQLDNEYISRLKTLSLNPGLAAALEKPLKVIYTPLHGAGNKLVRRILADTGFREVLVVREQELPDPDFTTVKSPNPEERAAFTLAIELAKKENADIIIGTDPDCDRVGLVVKNDSGEYVVLSGNQTGCLMLEYILSRKKATGELPENGFIMKTIVTTELARVIAGFYGIELVEVLTGFKFIGEQIKLLDEFGNKKFLFGFEESYGYLAGTFARDKDGVVTSMLAAEMAAYYKTRGMSLYEGLKELYEKYGHYLEAITSYTLIGKEGIEKIQLTMEKLRGEKPKSFNSSVIAAVRDYREGVRHEMATGNKSELGLPESDVLYYEMQDGSWFCIRPSGTEPKIKVYFGVSGSNKAAAESMLEKLQQNVLPVIKGLLYT